MYYRIQRIRAPRFGSATAAGILSYRANLRRTIAACRTRSSDRRELRSTRTGNGQGVHYYYMVFAKALQVMGEPSSRRQGGKHNWREELGASCCRYCRRPGNDKNPAEMQGNKTLVTSFTMMAIEAILQ
jgi:hypothetical protein